MKNVIFTLAIVAAFSLLTSCASIVGGAKYNAHIHVKDHPNAKIMIDDQYQGAGNAVVGLPRRKANKLAITVKEEGCEEQTTHFEKRAFRGGAFFGTLITWTGVISGVPVPWGLAVDLASGALFKPSVQEEGVSKVDYKNFKYVIDYTGCATRKASEVSVKTK